MRHRRWFTRAAVIVLGAGLLLGTQRVLHSKTATEPPVSRNLELEALQQAVRWPSPAVQTILSLVNEFLAAGRMREAYEYFHERAQTVPEQPLYLALEGLFQARMADQVFLLRRVAWVNEAVGKLDRAVSQQPSLPRYLRGIVLADLPARFGKAEAAVHDLEWVLQNKERFPDGLRRTVYRALARAYISLGRTAEAQEVLTRSGTGALDAAVPMFTSDYSVSAQDGFRFSLPRHVEPAPGVFVAQGYDFANLAFVVTDTGVVVIDTGTTEASARAALAAFRERTKLTQPVTHIILTHAHWDHVGGLKALTDTRTHVIAQAKFPEELRRVNETGVPFRYFFGSSFQPGRLHVTPTRLVSQQETLTVGGVEFVLYPATGGETEDALLILLPGKSVLFVGDMIMPYLGAPFLPEGSAEGLFEALALVRSLNPRVLIHGHVPLTELYTVDVLPTLEAALRHVYDTTLEGIRNGTSLTEILHQNLLPDVLRSHPKVVTPFLVMRTHFMTRVHTQRTGYWKVDGEGLERFTPREWAAALNLLAGGREDAFVQGTTQLLSRADYALALRVADAGLANYPDSQALTGLRRRALDALRLKYQQLNPFKFIIYSELAGAELSLPE